MDWRVFRCTDTARVWIWKQGGTGDGALHVFPDENTRLALYGQYPVEVVPREANLASIRVGAPVQKWPHHHSRNPLIAERQEHGWDPI